MHTLNRTGLAFALCLSALAGYIDAIGFLELGGYFVSFMSGNSTRLAVALSENLATPISWLGGIIGLFVLGAALGNIAGHCSTPERRPFTILLLITAILLIAALSHTGNMPQLSILLTALAMGAANMILQRDKDMSIGVTYMSGTLVKIGQRLSDVLFGGDTWAWLPYLFLWLSLIAGGITGTILFHLLGLNSLWLAVAWSGALALSARRLNGSVTQKNLYKP